ncbi:MAG: FHA domain-containing protein [Polyangiaceae bacterium]
MWKLTIEDDEQKQISVPLVHVEYGVGRDESNEIRLTERNISRRHAVLKQNGEGWLVRDLESYNGTYVNGLRVAGEQHVVHGDIVQLGDYRLEFVDERRLAPPVPDQTGVVAPVAPQPLPPHHRPDRLVVVVGPQPGQEFFLDREHFTIGRSEDANISVNHSSVSRLHAELHAIGNSRYEIIDKGSANGIRINGQDVRRGFIEAGDAIELGDVRLRFVGAGKIFRAGTDRSQTLPAVTGFDIKAASSKPANSGILKMVAVGAVLGVVGVAAAAAWVSTRPSTPKGSSSASAAREDAGMAILADAQKLFDAKKLDAAHQLLQTLDASSDALDEPALATIETAWAEAQFKLAEAETDADKRNDILWAVATTATVPEASRKKAAEKLKEVGIEVKPEDVVKPGTPAATNTSIRPKYKPTGAYTPGTSTNSGAPAPTLTNSGPRPAGSVDRDLIKKDTSEARRADLKNRLPSLNESETKTLIGLCQQVNDQACIRSAATHLGELRKK